MKKLGAKLGKLCSRFSGRSENPALMNAGLGKQGEKVLNSAGAAPSQVFLGLLAAIAKPVIAHVPLSVVTLGWGAGYLRG